MEAIVERGKGRVLDVGCGEGWLARTLSSRGFEVVGIDGSAALIDAARERGGGTFHRLSYEQLAMDPDAVAGPFDLVVCNFSILSEDATPLLRALALRLAHEATLLVQTAHPFTAAGDGPYRDGWREEGFSGFGQGFTAPMPWFFRTMGTWVRELRAAGLVVVECREPLNPHTGRPLSLLLVTRPA